MSDQYSMFPLEISPALPSATSSPASVSGPTPSAVPAGPTTALSGPEAVHVSRFRAQDSSAAMPTSDTSGPLFTHSSPSAALQRSLASRLRARMAGNGSPLYALTWKEVDMPAGPPISALRAQAHRTSGNGSSSWRTPNTVDAQLGDRKGLGQVQLCHQALLTGWPTPSATDGERNGSGITAGMTGTSLTQMAKMITGPARLTTHGELLTGCSAAMAAGGQLNPAHSRWLQGLPPAWDDCAATAMRSAPRSHKPSSRQ